MNKQCACEYHDLKQGDYLYKYSSWDGGINFEYIENIKYCPVCGKELPSEEDEDQECKKIKKWGIKRYV